MGEWERCVGAPCAGTSSRVCCGLNRTGERRNGWVLAMLDYACAWLRSRAKERAVAAFPGPVPRGRTREDEPAQGRTAFRREKEYDDGR
jgi:hypothetical protein